MRRTQPDARREHAERRRRRVRLREVAADRGIVEVEPPAAGPPVITLLGDGQADDRHGRIGDQPEQRRERLRREQRAMHRADDTRARRVARALGHRIEMVLRGEPFDRVPPPQFDAGDAPAQVAPLDERLGIARLVRTVERTEPEMDDARAQRAPVVARTGHLGRQCAAMVG
ncbi:hypothetical protein X941_5772 [Burkholderia pseudomallei MSHR5569]|nr:mannitol dehydrogenase domain protein [Burkholderia pseudomallei]KGS20664.1 hypothetical protein X941_5772 [Burkholderia pseudomallei MSHR5569]